MRSSAGAVAALLGVLAALGCDAEAAPTRAPPRAAADEGPRPLGALLRTLPLDGPEAPPARALPLVVALHGRGSRPERFAAAFEGLDVPARLLLVEAPLDEGEGRAWWSFRGKTGAEVASEMRALAGRILATIDRARAGAATAGAPVITGFSQGAMLVYPLALEHPGRFRAAIPVSGALFGAFVPAGPAREAPPLTVLHGEADPVIPAASGLRGIDDLRARGVRVETRTFPGVPHWIQGAMKDALHEAIRAALSPP